ncbi:MAG: DUF1444 domain-containing protein [Candidatus Xenobia bacterium]
MSDANRFVCTEGRFSLLLPGGWEVQPDAEAHHWKVVAEGRVMARIATWDCAPQDNAERLMERHLKDTAATVLERGSRALSGGGDLAWVRFARTSAGRSYEGVWMAARNAMALRLVRRQLEEDDEAATTERNQVRDVAESLELLAEARPPEPAAAPASLAEIRNLLLPRLLAVPDPATALQSVAGGLKVGLQVAREDNAGAPLVTTTDVARWGLYNADAVNLAVRNLQRRPLPAVVWDLHDAPKTVALAWEDAWSAERLLVTDVLRGLSERFAAGVIAVAVPDRMALIVSHDASPQFMEYVQERHRTAADALSPEVFRWSARGGLAPVGARRTMEV